MGTIKRLFFLFFLMIFSVALYAEPDLQKEQPVKTKIETFSDASGIVILNGYDQVGKLNGLQNSAVSVEIRETTHASSGEKVYGVGIYANGGGKYDRDQLAYLDYEELDSLIKGLGYLSKFDSNKTSLSNYKALYASNSKDFKIIVYNYGGEVYFDIRVGRINSQAAVFKFSDFHLFQQLIEKSKSELDRIKGFAN